MGEKKEDDEDQLNNQKHLECLSDVSWKPFGGLLGRLGGPLAVHRGSWASLGASGGLLGPLGVLLGGSSGPFGGLLGASWDHLGAILGPSWGLLGPPGRLLEPSWRTSIKEEGGFN